MIQTIKARIQVRYGLEADLQPDKLATGEWSAATDTRKVWMCFRPGLVLRMATYEAFEEDMREIQLILATCQNIQAAVERFMQLAQQHSTQAEEWSVTSKSWAVGGTGTRKGENTNNSQFWSNQSKAEADRAKEEADRAADITGIDIMTGATASAAGKAGLAPAPGAGKQNAYLRGDGTWVTPATTLTGTVAGIPLDQTMGKKLDDKISVINSNLSRKIAEITPDKYISKIFFRKNGNTVTVLLEKSTSEITLMNETMVIGKVPEGFRPLAYVSTMLLLTLNAVPAYFAINSLGDIAIRIRGNIKADIMLYTAFTYVI